MRLALLLLLAAVSEASDPAQRPSTEFASGIVSTPAHEGPFALTPDGQTIYFTRFVAGTLAPEFFVSHRRDGQWTAASSAAFPAGVAAEPFSISPDGQRLFYTHVTEASGRSRLWVAERNGEGWANAGPLPGAIEEWSANQYSPSVAADGTLYFTSKKASGSGGWDIYRSALTGGQYAEPVLLGGGPYSRLSTMQHEKSVTVAPDGTYLVFSSSCAANGFGGSDLYIAGLPRSESVFVWVENLGPLVNTPGDEFDPRLSADGKRLYFSRSGDIHEVDWELVRQDSTDSSAWKRRGQMPAPRQWPQLAAANDRIYVYGGLTGGLGTPGLMQWWNVVEVYDPASHSWSPAIALPAGWVEAAIVSMDNRLFLFRRGGQGIAEYRADRGQWEIQRATLPFTIAQNAPFRTRTVVLGRKAYTTFTAYNQREHSYFVEYDFDSGAWTQKRSMPFPTAQVAAFDGRIYSFSGGETATNVSIYDPVEDAWTAGAPMDMPRWESALAVLDNKIWLIGGHGLRSSEPMDGDIHPTVMCFDPIRNEWSRGPDLPAQRAAAAAVNVNGRLFVFGGLHLDAVPSYEPSVIEYVP